MVLAAGTIGTYVFNYMTTFAQHTLHMTPGPVVPGRRARQRGRGRRRPVRRLAVRPDRPPAGDDLAERSLNLALILPVFFWITGSRTRAGADRSARRCSRSCGAIGAGAFYAAVAESLPKRIRGSDVRDGLRLLDRHLRRHHPAGHHLADPGHRQRHGAGLVSVRPPRRSGSSRAG